MVEKCQISWLIVPAGRTRRHLLLSRQTDIKLIMLLFWSYLCPEAASAKTASFYWILWETFLKIITLFKHFIALFIIFKLFAFHCLLSRWTKYDFFFYIFTLQGDFFCVVFREIKEKFKLYDLNLKFWKVRTPWTALWFQNLPYFWCLKVGKLCSQTVLKLTKLYLKFKRRCQTLQRYQNTSGWIHNVMHK